MFGMSDGLKHNYPKHVAPSTYVIDFTWIANPLLRAQMKTLLPTSASTMEWLNISKLHAKSDASLNAAPAGDPYGKHRQMSY